MKKINLSLILLIFGVFFSSLFAQRVINTHKLGFYLEAGEWSMLPREADFKASLGGGGAIGFNYEMQRRHFLLDLGFGAMVGQTTFKVGSLMDQHYYNAANAIMNTPFTFVYEMKDGKHAYTQANAQVPVLLGAAFNRFYFLAGAKLNFNIWNQCRVFGPIDTYGVYEHWDSFHNMPMYQFYDGHPFSATTSTSFNLDIDASVELGFRLGDISNESGWDIKKNRSNCEYRLALFADYGILDYHKADNRSPMSAPHVYNKNDMFSTLTVADILSTTNAASAVNNLMIGVKFTMLFALPEPKVCVICKEARRSNYSGRTKILEELIF